MIEAANGDGGAGDHLRKHANALPSDRVSEFYVLSAILKNPGCLDVVIPILKVSDFSDAKFGIVYTEMLALHGVGAPIDAKTLWDSLGKHGDKSKALTFVMRLMSGVGVPENVAYHARKIVEKAQERDTILVLSSTLKDVTSCTDSHEEKMERTERSVFDVTKRRHVANATPLDKVLRETIAQMDHRQGGGVVGVRSGFDCIDEKTNGFQKKELSLVAARAGRGKTSLLINMLRRVCDPNSGTGGLSAAFFALEMSVTDVNLNLLCSIARVDTREARSGNLPPGHVAAIYDAAQLIESWKIHYHERARLTVQDVRARLRMLKSEGGCDIAFVDYLQLMSSPSDRRNRPRHEEVAEVSRGLKEIAMDLDMPIVAAAQLNRNAEGNRPQLSDLRESGSLEQDAALVLAIHQEDENTKRETEFIQTGAVDLLILKNRFGPVGDVRLIYDKTTCNFREPNQ